METGSEQVPERGAFIANFFQPKSYDPLEHDPVLYLPNRMMINHRRPASFCDDCIDIGKRHSKSELFALSSWL